jgi:hypothetical protein
MRLLPALGALVLVAMMANAARPCDAYGLLGTDLPAPGPLFIPFPTALPTPGGHLATGAYLDGRDHVCVAGVEFCSCGGPAPFGCFVTQGDGTWLYLETNGLEGLQRGGASSVVPCLGQVGPVETCDRELAACETSDPDELVY